MIDKFMKPVIVALDFPNLKEVKEFIPKLENRIATVKVGMELFYSEGPKAIEYLKKQNLKIFLDLKLHDIPSTVKSALKVIDKMGVDIVNVHALGGYEMMARSREVIQKTQLIGVTVLTSHDHKSLHQLNLLGNLEANVVNLAKLTFHAGLDGIVCSAQDLVFLTPKLPKNFLYITPGIRLQSAANDQVRVMKPSEAIKAGATSLVIGREITRAKNIADSLDAIGKDLNA